MFPWDHFNISKINHKKFNLYRDIQNREINVAKYMDRRKYREKCKGYIYK